MPVLLFFPASSASYTWPPEFEDAPRTISPSTFSSHCALCFCPRRLCSCCSSFARHGSCATREDAVGENNRLRRGLRTQRYSVPRFFPGHFIILDLYLRFRGKRFSSSSRPPSRVAPADERTISRLYVGVMSRLNNCTIKRTMKNFSLFSRAGVFRCCSRGDGGSYARRVLTIYASSEKLPLHSIAVTFAK